MNSFMKKESDKNSKYKKVYFPMSINEIISKKNFL